jgi:hypothetical protein
MRLLPPALTLVLLLTGCTSSSYRVSDSAFNRPLKMTAWGLVPERAIR